MHDLVNSYNNHKKAKLTALHNILRNIQLIILTVWGSYDGQGH